MTSALHRLYILGQHVTVRHWAACIVCLVITGCGSDTSAPEVPVFDDPQLQQGRGTWVQICRNCHLMGVAGAPRIGDAENWRARAVKGRAALHQNAINGIGEHDNWTMPPRGGEARLTDEQVRSAVDFMLAASLGTDMLQ